jgi:hypothetical protein
MLQTRQKFLGIGHGNIRPAVAQSSTTTMSSIRISAECIFSAYAMTGDVKVLER